MYFFGRSFRLILAGIFVVSVSGTPANGAPPVTKAEPIQLTYKGINLIATPPRADAGLSIPLMAMQAGMKKMRDALDLLYEKSTLSRTTIEKLKKSGPVFIVYDPNFPKKVEDLTKIWAAAFFPNYLKNHGIGNGEDAYLAVVSRHGIKWTTPELAAVLAHELVGHAMQQMLGRFTYLRNLELECEAWLFQEQVLQDLAVDKLHRDIVTFRQNLEFHYCSDFKRYLSKKDPEAAKLWDVLNPDVPRLLAAFEEYAKSLHASGASGKAIETARGQRIEERFRLLVEKGTPDDQFALALAYREGSDIPQDLKKAAKLFELAAQGGVKEAQLEMGFIYDKGLGIDPSPGKATKWFYHAAAQGQPFAQFKLAQRLIAGTGVRQDKVAAVKWFQRSAKQGFALAQYHLAKKYATGDGVPKDDAEAAKWFQKAAHQGDKRSQFILARMLRKGIGLPKDEGAAVSWYKKSAEAGHLKAQLSLAFLYEKGQGIGKDLVQAYKWYALLAEKNVMQAITRLEKITKELSPEQLSQGKKLAMEWKLKKE